MGDSIKQAIDMMTARANSSKRSKEIDAAYQPVVFLKDNDVIVKFGPFRKIVEQKPFQYYSQRVFQTKEEAIAYMPQFVKELIKKGDLPKESIANGQLDSNVVMCAMQSLELATLERNID